MLSGSGSAAERTPAAVRAAAAAAADKPDCSPPGEHSQVRLEIEGLGEDGLVINVPGVGAMPADEDAAAAASEAAFCHTAIELDPALLDCTTTPGWCTQGSKYYQYRAGDLEWASTGPVAPEAVPADTKAYLDAGVFEPTARTDGELYGPPQESERPCFECPGPAPSDPQLYCVKTHEDNWVGFRW